MTDALDVLPRQAMDDLGDGCVVHAVLTSERPHGDRPLRIGMANGSHVIRAEFGRVDRFASSRSLRLRVTTIERTVNEQISTTLMRRTSFGAHVPHVVGLCTQKQVIRPNASRRVTPMKNLHVIRDRAMRDSEGNAVGEMWPLAPDRSELPISGLEFDPHPKPAPVAAREIDQSPETLSGVIIETHLLSFQVGATPPAVPAARWPLCA